MLVELEAAASEVSCDLMSRLDALCMTSMGRSPRSLGSAVPTCGIARPVLAAMLPDLLLSRCLSPELEGLARSTDSKSGLLFQLCPGRSRRVFPAKLACCFLEGDAGADTVPRLFCRTTWDHPDLRGCGFDTFPLCTHTYNFRSCLRIGSKSKDT